MLDDLAAALFGSGNGLDAVVDATNLIDAHGVIVGNGVDTLLVPDVHIPVIDVLTNIPGIPEVMNTLHIPDPTILNFDDVREGVCGTTSTPFSPEVAQGLNSTPTLESLGYHHKGPFRPGEQADFGPPWDNGPPTDGWGRGDIDVQGNNRHRNGHGNTPTDIWGRPKY